MGEFSADWLALREAADHRSRSPELAGEVARSFANQERISIVDLGCGTGSNLRALAPLLPREQTWRLVDHDEALLSAARDAISRWADDAEERSGDLFVTRAGRRLRISFVCANLARDLGTALGTACDLVTAAALLDLVSVEWIGLLAEEVARRKAAFYAVLNYTREERWSPLHPADADLFRTFHEHHARDKGFGSPAGSDLAAAVRRAFTDRHYRVRTADSPWHLGAEDAVLVQALATGIADAVRETGSVDAAVISDWLRHRLSGATCTVNHCDFFAAPSA
ncbi:class I SAM-dependent methyltransferase [Microvirga massiliensis]|uniref:class I SAM-dependent methyltransferase n=1 Tax=Microvirga massiliensis TaxID=1033741 RepID=UPI00062BA690|nr:class I SAM-dependent methyltransferase [Microvirga massiliensis]